MLGSELCGKRVWFLLRRQDQIEGKVDLAMDVDMSLWSHTEVAVRRRLVGVRNGAITGLRYENLREWTAGGRQ